MFKKNKDVYSGLWRNKAFLKYWCGVSLSILGSQITSVAIPLLAAITINASAGQMGALGAIQFSPYLLIGLFVGVWADRFNRRKLMIIAAICRALLISSIPIVAIMGLLTIEQLYIVGFLMGVCSLFFDVAYQSYLPILIGRDKLQEGNAKIEGTATLLQVSGSSFAGALVQIITAPLTLILDALSYLISAIVLSKIQDDEQELVQKIAPQERKSIIKNIVEGLEFVFKNKMLKAIAACTATSNFFGRILFTVYILYLTRTLNVSPTMYGIIIAVGGIGAFIGTLIARRLTRRFGIGKVIVFSILIGNAVLLIVPLAGLINFPMFITIPILIIVQFIWSMSNPIYNINQVSIRQTITPTELLGRMNASMRTIVWGTVPLGYIAGGVLGAGLGIWWTLLIGSIGGVLAFLWIAFSSVFYLTDINSLNEATA